MKKSNLEKSLKFLACPFDKSELELDIPNSDEVKEGEEYALLLTTNAGAWRYLIGDTVKFVSIEDSEIIITGRTKH